MRSVSKILISYLAYSGNDWRYCDRLDPVSSIAEAGLSLTLQRYWSDGHHLRNRTRQNQRYEWAEAQLRPSSRRRSKKNPALVQAAIGNDLEAVRFLLEQTVDRSFCYGSEKTLVSTASAGFTEVVRSILDFWDVSKSDLGASAVTEFPSPDNRDSKSTPTAGPILGIEKPLSIKEAKNQALDHALAKGHEPVMQILF
jgi:hypothetical protein